MLVCVLEQAESHLIVRLTAQSAVHGPKSSGAGQQASSLDSYSPETLPTWTALNCWTGKLVVGHDFLPSINT